MRRIVLMCVALIAATYAGCTLARANPTVCPQRPASPERYTRITYRVGGKPRVAFIGPNGRGGKNTVAFEVYKRDNTSLREFVNTYFLHDPQFPEAHIIEPYANAKIDICGEAYLLRYRYRSNNEDITISQDATRRLMASYAWPLGAAPDPPAEKAIRFERP